MLISDVVLTTIISLTALGTVAAIILYYASQKFKVYEDPKINEVEEALPGANCGACGFPGCRGFAEAIVKADNFNDLNCPVGGNETMQKVAEILGQEMNAVDEQVAVVRCNGTANHRRKVNVYDGASSCAIATLLYAGETDCQYGCLGFGDCVQACEFDALHMDLKTGLPVVTDDNCTACNACVEECQKDIIEKKKKNKKDRKIFVSCINQDKGPVAKKACEVACIGCGKCVKVCPYDAITLENYLAYIDPYKCKLCRKCVEECPTSAILEVNFPPRKRKKEDEKATA